MNNEYIPGSTTLFIAGHSFRFFSDFISLAYFAMSGAKSLKVLVTGARGSLGSAVLKKFAQSGATVFGADMDGPFEKVSGTTFIPVNLSDTKSVKESLGGLEADVLVHCAGGFRFSMTDQLQDNDLDFLINANLKSGIILAREVLPSMKKKNFGRIVFVSARGTQNPSAGLGAYLASKAGLNMLVGSLADETKDFNINVNAVLPTIIDTPMNRMDMPQANFSKWVQPTELADIMHSLTTPLFNSVHGALIPVAGRV